MGGDTLGVKGVEVMEVALWRIEDQRQQTDYEEDTAQLGGVGLSKRQQQRRMEWWVRRHGVFW